MGCAGCGCDGVGAPVHHPCVEAVGHGERLEVGLKGQRQRQFVHQVNRSAGDDGATAQVLKAQHFVGLPEPLHAVSHEDDPGKLREGLCDVEVTQGADLEEGHP